jgi:uncharacterized protein (TIGR02452 family)
MELQRIAEETIATLPNVLAAIPTFKADISCILNLDTTDAADPKMCPGYGGATIKVLNMDTFDAALLLNPHYTIKNHLGLMGDATGTEDIQPAFSGSVLMSDAIDAEGIQPALSSSERPVVVLNLASEFEAGGGWTRGALAQEECLCYRSSLYLSLHDEYYPLPSLSAIWTPNVVLIRESMASGHALLDKTPPEDLPALSVISVAALRRPDLTRDRKSYRSPGARAETKRKIRVILRVAAMQGHTKLVLGALGCGVFLNPPTEVAQCFLEVLREEEFQGGWWEDVVFAVLDNAKGPNGGKDGSGNFGQFFRVLDGQVV